jgi:hypothetical protein
MLKALVILAVILAVNQATVPATGHSSDNDTGKSNTRQNKSGSHQEKTTDPTSIPKPVESSRPKDERNDPDSANSKEPLTVTVFGAVPNKRDWVDYVSLGLGTLLFGVTFAGVWAAWRGLPEFKRQAKAAEDAAASALLNAQALINSERPWVLVTSAPHPEYPGVIVINAINKGRTPAVLIANSKDELVLYVEGNDLPQTPPERTTEPITPSVILLPDEATELAAITVNNVRLFCGSEAQYFRVKDWQDKIYYYGSLLYRDLLSVPESAPHETGWCFRYIPARDGDRLIEAGPNSYHRHS